MWIWETLEAIDRKLNQLVTQQSRILSILTKEGTAIMGMKEDIDNMVAEVEENTSVAEGVQTLLSNLTTMLTDIKSQVTDPASQAKLQDAIQRLDANNKAIAAAVVANTPAAES